MKDDDKDLLFADACARLKYNVKAKYQCFHIHSVQGLTSKGLVILCNETNQFITTNVENIRTNVYVVYLELSEEIINQTNYG